MIRISSKPSSKPEARGFSLGVSMGSTNHTGPLLEGIVDWINKSEFEYGIIDLSDTLNRHSFMIGGMNENQAFIETRRQGDVWLKNNLALLKKIKAPIKIIRWNEWLNDSRYPAISREVWLAIDGEPQLRTALYMDISNYYARKGHSCSAENLRLSMQYFAEEISAHTLLHSDYDVASIYPGKQLEAYKLIRSGSVKNFPAGIKRSSYIRLMPHNIGDLPLQIQTYTDPASIAKSA